jgi:hypothetical protein
MKIYILILRFFNLNKVVRQFLTPPPQSRELTIFNDYSPLIRDEIVL